MIQNLTKLSVKCSSYNCRTIGANAAALLLVRTGAEQIFCRDVACYVLCAAEQVVAELRLYVTCSSAGLAASSNPTSKAAGEGARPTLCGLPGGDCSFILLLRFIHRYPVHQEQRFFMPKRTFQPNRRHRSKTHGFLTRMKTKAGRAVISRRRAKGRKRVSVKPGFRE